MTKNTKRVSLILLILLLAASLCAAVTALFTPATVKADEETHADHTGWTELTADTALADGEKYYLSADVTKNITVAKNTTVTLCLNGFTLRGGG